MIWRQVQKVSRGSGPRASGSPAMARWKACECRFAIAGRTRSQRSPDGAAPASTRAIRPSGPTSMPTASAQPSGSRARSAQIVVIVFALPSRDAEPVRIAANITANYVQT